ncbi:MAG: hypothetical protein ACTIJ6_01880 [Leucobacter sp.]
MKLVTRAAIVVGLGTTMAIAPVTMAMAADHEASITDGLTSVSLNLGTDAANARTGIVIVDIDADAADPEDSDVVYANEVSTDELGVATLQLELPSAELEGYRILANYPGGSLYSAPLAGVDDDGGDGGDGDGNGGGTDGDGSGDGGSGDGSSGDGSGDGSGNAGGGSDGETSVGAGAGQDATADQLSDTGASAGWIAATAAVGGFLVAAGITLFARKRRQALRSE